MGQEASYLTEEGAVRLRNELNYLKGPGREQLSQRLRSAIQQGDLSENADYINAKEEQAFLEGRIAELEMILKNIIIIEQAERKADVIGIGHHVTIQEEDFPEETYHIVGTKEADSRKGKISHESPIGEALLGHGAGDEVTVKTPGGSILLKILKIE
jgi:transcription elongation factor GreA